MAGVDQAVNLNLGVMDALNHHLMIHHHYHNDHHLHLLMPNKMPTAHANRRLHSSLLDCAVSSSATSFSRLKWAIRVLPPHLRLAIYEKMHDQGRLCQLGYEWCDLEVFEVVLSVKHRRYQVHQIFQALMDHGLRLNEVLTSCLHTKCSQFLAEKRWTVKEVTNLLNLSIDLGRFLLDASWYVASQRCFQLSLTIIDETPNVSSDWRDWQRIQVYHWLMDVYNSNCVYKDALVLYERSWALVKKYSEQKRPPLNLADVFIQYALMFFNVGDYDQAVGWAVDALKQIDGGRTSIRTVIEVCRHASKMLLTRRQFKQAELLVQHAVALAKYHFDDARRMPAPLLDFGFFLMNMDRTEAAVKIYQRALEYRQAQFGGHNLKVAQAFEDLAYSLYVQEYSSGNFAVAKECSEKAITITKLLLPDNHLLLASCRRVKALILEEIAIDSHDKAVESALLAEADDLHLSALSLYKRVFGDNNVQTAKHYGNLGRLYQSMRRFEEAEAMHKKAIEVKQRLLGDDDYEVALSIGHLASLYNHDLDRFDEAEKLYLRSIEIERKLFGDTYSGLEYDYRGLVQVYVGLGDDNKAAEYMRRLSEWKAARDIEQAQRNPILLWNSIPTPPESTKFVMETFFKKYM